jgi:hypothetical protein
MNHIASFRTVEGKLQEEKPRGEWTGFLDNNCTQILVGDFMFVEHFCNCEYCRQRDLCEVTWNPEWRAYGLRADDGRWLSGMGIAGSVVRR